MMRFLLICAGGAAGTGSRYLLEAWVTTNVTPKIQPGFPFGTLTVNVVGCLVMGFLAQFATSHAMSETSKLVLATGVLGGFTTYSAFNKETMQLFQLGAWPMATTYLLATVMLCFVAGATGVALARTVG